MGKETTDYRKNLEEYQERLRKRFDEMAGTDDDFLDELPDEADDDGYAYDEDEELDGESAEKIYDIDSVMLRSRDDLLEEALGVAEFYNTGRNKKRKETSDNTDKNDGKVYEDDEAVEVCEDDEADEAVYDETSGDKVNDSEAYDEEAYNEETYDGEAYDEEAYDEETYDDEAYDEGVYENESYEDDEAYYNDGTDDDDIDGNGKMPSGYQKLQRKKTVQAKRMRSKNYKWYIALGIVSVLFIVVTICYLVSNARYAINKLDIHEINSSMLMSNTGIKSQMSDYTTIALFGVDSKDGNKNQGANSDTIIIISINEKTKEMSMVSVYKDTYMYLENGMEDRNKLLYAYQTGGALSAINTLNVNLDLYITDYITVDYSAMAELIDALGGVTVTVDEDEVNSLNKNLAEQLSISGKYSDGVYDAGRQKLSGQQAVAYMRIKNVGTGDVDRTKRQREVMTDIYNRLADADEGDIKTLIGMAVECVSTSMTESELLELMNDFSDAKLTCSMAYPISFEKAEPEGKGTVLVASSMTENVSVLHDYLYGTNGYVPTELVQNISDAISLETGIGNSGITADNAAGYDTFDENEAGDTEDSVTLTDAPSGMDIYDE